MHKGERSVNLSFFTLHISLYIIYVILWLVTYDVIQDSHIRWREVLRQCMYGDYKLKLSNDIV